MSYEGKGTRSWRSTSPVLLWPTKGRAAMSKSCYLTTTELHRLDIAVAPLLALSHGVYLVGSVSERPDFRDVDVRLILADEDFDRLFRHSPELWSVFCYAVSRMLSADTGLPIDFQVQRQTEANEKHDKPRNHLGNRAKHAMFAGQGDATQFGDCAPMPSLAGADQGEKP